MNYRKDEKTGSTIRFYAVPLGVYFKLRRQTQNRETILREYASEMLDIYRTVLPANSIYSLIELQSLENQPRTAGTSET